MANQSFCHASGIPFKWIVFWVFAASSLVNNTWARCIWVHLAKTELNTWWPHLLRRDMTRRTRSIPSWPSLWPWPTMLLQLRLTFQWLSGTTLGRWLLLPPSHMSDSASLDACLELLRKWDVVMYWQLCRWSHGWICPLWWKCPHLSDGQNNFALSDLVQWQRDSQWF